MVKTQKPAVIEDSGSEDSTPLPEIKAKNKNKANTPAQQPQKPQKPTKKPAAEEESDEDTPVNNKKVAPKAPRKGSKVSVDDDNHVAAKTNPRKASVDKPKKQVKKDDSEEESSVEKPVTATKKQDNKAKPVAKNTKPAKQESSEQSEDEIVSAPKKTTPQPVSKKDTKATKVAAKKQESESEESEQEQPAKKQPPAKKAGKVVAKQESSDEQSEVKPAAKKVEKPQPKKNAKPAVESDEQESEEKKPQTRKVSKENIKVDNKKKPAAKKQTSSEQEEQEPQPAKKKPAAKGKKIEESEEESEQKPQPKRKASGQNLSKKAQKPAEQQAQEQQQEGEFEIAVRGLSFNAYDSDVRDLFSSCGTITNVKMINRPDGKPKGFAFVKFTTRSALNKALELNETEHLGRTINVEQARGKANGGREAVQGQGRINNQQGTANIETPTLFIGGLSFNSTVESMKQFFASVGNVQSVRIVSDKETQKPRGFGYVEFYDVETAKKAYETLNGQYLDGRQIRLDSATQRDRSNAPNGGGRQFGGQGGQGGFRGGRNDGNSAVNLSQDDRNAKKGAIAGFQGKKMVL